MRDEDSVANNGLTEIKIVDNQIMNFNNRSDYLEGILNALDGLYYYINDFNSTGILYYEVGDLYNVQIKENTYQCLMLNDEVNVTTGIEEIIYTDIPEKSETDYSKADKTDMKINKTYIIVDKQNQTIESVVNNVTEQNNKISQITQTVNEINSKVQDIADITTYGESDKAEVELTDINESEPIMIKVHPTSTNISYLYPSENLYPSDTQFMRDRIIRFTRTYKEEGQTLTENIDYTLPDDLLRYSNTVYDEFYLDYDSQTCQIIKRCAYNADGTVRALGTEITTDYPYPTIALGEGNYTITLLGYDFGYIYARLMAKNIYTTQFYTKAETESRINQKANEINLGVNQTLTNYSTTNEMNSAIILKANEITNSVSATYSTKTELGTVERNLTASLELKINTDDLISEINASADVIRLTAGRLLINSGNFQLDSSGNITCIGGTIGGITINNSGLYYSGSSSTEGFGLWKNGVNSHNNSYIIFHAGGNNSNIGGASTRIYQNGSLYTSKAYITGGSLSLLGGNDSSPLFQNYNTQYSAQIIPWGFFAKALNTNAYAHLYTTESGGSLSLASNSISINNGGVIATASSSGASLFLYGSSGTAAISLMATSTSTSSIYCYGSMYAYNFTNLSKESKKKCITKFKQNASKIIKNSELYEFKYKEEDDTIKKHIGFIIGDEGGNYLTPNEVISSNKDGIDTYTMCSIMWKALQEQQQEIEELKERIK